MQNKLISIATHLSTLIHSIFYTLCTVQKWTAQKYLTKLKIKKGKYK